MPYRVGHGNAGLTGGEVKAVTLPEPPLGGILNVPVPSGKIWRIMQLHFSLSTSAAAGNRTVRVHMAGGTLDTMFDRFSGYAHPPSQTKGYSIGATTSSVWGVSPSGGEVIVPLPTSVLLPGSETLRIEWLNRDPAGDQLSTPLLLVEEWEGV